MSGKTCFVTGGAGNLACQLSWRLAQKFDQLVLVDRAERPLVDIPSSAQFEQCDITDDVALGQLLGKYKPCAIVHLASLLSGSCENDRPLAWRVNCDAFFQILERAVAHNVATVLFPSSVATYGGEFAESITLDTPQWPDSLYGVTKVACERLGAYFRKHHEIDFRCVRLPITVSRFAPQGAASAYASRAFIECAAQGQYTFHVHPSTRTSLVYIEDVLDGFMRLLLAPADRLSLPVYNVHAITASAQELAECIHLHVPDATIVFSPDPQIVDLVAKWPQHICDKSARNDWGWQPQYDLQRMSRHFIQTLRAEGSQS